MFEAKLEQASLLKKILESIKDLVSDANFDCSSSGLSLQAMDSAHVSLVHLLLKADGFSHFRCDRTLQLGINLPKMAKILKCASNEDSVTIKAEDDGDQANLIFESKDQERYSEFGMKLMNIEAEQWGIPDTEYQAIVQMPSSEFKKICSDLSSLDTDTVSIAATKAGVKFSVNGAVGDGSITIRHNASVDKQEESTIIELKEPVTLTFALKYLNIFCKSTTLSGTVTLSLHQTNPLLVQYKFTDSGHIRYYLAPNIDEDNEDEDEEM